MILGGVDCASAMLMAIAAPTVAAVTERVMMFRANRCTPRKTRWRTFRIVEVQKLAAPLAGSLAGASTGKEESIKVVRITS